MIERPVPEDMPAYYQRYVNTVKESELLEALEKLGNRGVEVLSCGLCLDFFNIKDNLRAGAVTNMFTIAESLMQAGSVVRL